MSSEAVCPKCRRKIPLEDVNVATDIALCRSCVQTWKYSEIVQVDDAASRYLTHPPPGTWRRENPPNGFEVGASTRSPLAFVLIPFMCLWSGSSLTAIYGMQIHKGHFSLGTSLFGLPFLLGTVGLGSVALMAICGKVVVSVDRDNGMIFTGVGQVGWRRRFNWRGVTAIRRTERHGRNGPQPQITLEGEKRLRFGTGLKAERMDYLLAVLQSKWRGAGRG
jgi:hypothetical protein